VGLSAGVRKEWNNRSSDEWTYQLGGRLTLLEGLDLLANFGTAFRAPTLNELFFTSPFSAGNPDLRPERSRGGDLGLRWICSCEGDLRWEADLRAFHQSFEDLIEFRDQGGFFFRPVNVERARMSGAEASMRLDWRSLWISTSYTLLRTRDTAGMRLARRPRHAGRLSIGGDWDRFRVEVVVHAVGKSHSFAAERSPVESYWTADVHLSARLHEYLTARLSVRNLTNHGYEEVSGRGTLPRMAFFSLEASF
jgi:vitamin B12 transporter